MIKSIYHSVSLTAGVVALAAIAGCSDSKSVPVETVNGSYQAVITTVSADFGSSEISLANTIVMDDTSTTDIDESETSYDIVNGFAAQDLSDIRAVTYGKNFYRLGRSSQHHITKYSFDDPNIEQWQFSIDLDGENGGNPHDMVFVNESKAYVIRYGASSILIVNPSVSANEEDDFVLGEIDLSAYDADGIPEMHRAVIHNGVMYVVVQAHDANYVPREAYLVAIDTVTDQEINIGSNVLNGLPLNVRNPVDLDLFGDYVYVSAIGRYGSSFSTPPRAPEYTGGIERISLNDFSSQVIVDDGNATIHPYGQINELTIVSSELAYFAGYHGWKNLSVYQFNPSTGNVVSDAVVVNADGNKDIRALETSPEGYVWVGVGDDVSPAIKVLDPSDNTVVETILTDKIPGDIEFSSNLSQ